MATMMEGVERESDNLFRSCEEMVGGEKRTPGDIELLVRQIVAVEVRGALYDNLPPSTAKK